MAEKPGAAGPPAGLKTLASEANDRLEGCRKQKNEFDLDLREGYFFAAPHRARDIRSSTRPTFHRLADASERETGIATELARDFVTRAVDAFMPQAEPWAERRPGMFIPPDKREQVKKDVADQDDQIFDAIRASNLYEILPMAFNPDLSLGTAALWIEDLRPAENIVVQAVPLRELEINVGPYGEIDDRFIVRHTKNRRIKALLPNIQLPHAIEEKIRTAPNEFTEIRWGFWRLWDRRDDMVWQHVVMVKKDVIHAVELKGEGGCPLLPMRFNASPEWAYGEGPTIEGLPDFRQLDSLEGSKIDHVELKLHPPTAYPDDGFAAIEADGIEPGRAYPVRPGSEDAIKPIFDGGDIQAAVYETTQLEERLRRMHFLQFPQQRGKTPPTLGQWIDEMAEAQRQIGTPGMSFWREGPAQIFLRYKYLLEQRGIIEPIKVDGKIVSLEPYNPAQRAAEQQLIAMAARYIQLMSGPFPEGWKINVDDRATMEAFMAMMRVGDLVKLRKPEAVKAAVAQIAQLTQGRQQIHPADPTSQGVGI